MSSISLVSGHNFSKVRLCSLQWVCRSPWGSGSGRPDSEVLASLEDSNLISQTVHTHSHDAHSGPRGLQPSLQKAYVGNPPIHKCPYCPYTSRLSSNTKRHVRTHTGEMPYSCSECDFRCKDASSMKRHKVTHTRRSNSVNINSPI